MDRLRCFTLCCFLIVSFSAWASKHHSDSTAIKPFHRFYISWGYTKAWYSNSDIRFTGTYHGNSYDFTIQQAHGSDRPDMHALIPEVTVPQYVYRIGYFFDKKRVWAIEFNFDHTKYIMDDYQTAHVKGTINNSPIDRDTLISPTNFVHFEHTNGANFYLINGVRRLEIWKSKHHTFRLNAMVKAGFGFVVPKTDVTLWGTRLDNRFHLAGYMCGVEGTFRLNLGRWFFIEPSVKGAFVHYVNSLTVEGGKAEHHFFAFEAMGTFGFSFL